MPDSAAALANLEAKLLRLFPALAGAAAATLARIVRHGVHRKATAGTVMFDAHTPCSGFPLVLAGTVKVLQRYPNGREMPPTDFQALIASDAAFRDHVFSLFGERLATLMSLVEAIAYQKLDQRLAMLLLRKEDPVRATHQALADELGSVREMVSRLLRAFEDRGWVDLARERIHIVDRDALETLASA